LFLLTSYLVTHGNATLTEQRRDHNRIMPRKDAKPSKEKRLHVKKFDKMRKAAEDGKVIITSLLPPFIIAFPLPIRTSPSHFVAME
jgi:hypothetical protein